MITCDICTRPMTRAQVQVIREGRDAREQVHVCEGCYEFLSPELARIHQTHIKTLIAEQDAYIQRVRDEAWMNEKAASK